MWVACLLESLLHLTRTLRELHNCRSSSVLYRSVLKWLSSGVQHGPPDSPFAGGEYHGVLLFPSEYPFKPPGIKVCVRWCFSCAYDRPLPPDVNPIRPLPA